MSRQAELQITVTDMPVFHALMALVDEFATHHRDCAAVDADGEWRPSHPPCDCGYHDALDALKTSAGPSWKVER